MLQPPIVWCPTPNFLLDYSVLKNIPLIKNSTMINSTYLSDEIKLNKDYKKIVLMKDIWFHLNDKKTVLFDEDLSWADLCILTSSEIVNNDRLLTERTFNKFKNNNFIFIYNGFKPIKNINNIDKFFQNNLYFFHALTQFNKSLIYDNIETSKLFLFDALLGTNKFHRRYLFDLIVENQLIDHGLINLTQSPFIAKNKTYQSSVLDQFDHPTMVKFRQETKHDPKLNYSAQSFNLQQPNLESYHAANISFILPNEIFKNTWYSLISETLTDMIFFTEKTAKGFLSKRIFIFFGAQHSLKKLKEFGFKTFDNIIDENYDSEPKNIVRIKKAFEQLLKLKNLSQAEHYENYLKCQDILEHNFNLLVNGNLQLKEMQDFIQMHINRIK